MSGFSSFFPARQSPNTNRTFGRSPTTCLRDRLERRVDLDRDHRPGVVGELRGQRPGAGADLQHRVGLVEFGRADDQIDEVEVDEEVLPELALGLQAVGLEQAGEVGERLPRRRDGWCVWHRRLRS